MMEYRDVGFKLVINPFQSMGYNGYILKSEVGMRKSEVEN
jgi:hypothetical protein